jgi:dephospho-CoA kinase
MPAEEKAARAHFVIRTDGSFQDTDAQVRSIWSQLESSS